MIERRPSRGVIAGLCVSMCVFVACSLDRSGLVANQATDGGGDTAPPTCEGTSEPACVDGQIRRCNGGVVEIVEACSLGCTTSGTLACLDLVPSNLGALDWKRSKTTVTIGSDGGPVWVFGTDDGSIAAYASTDLSAGVVKVIRAAGNAGNSTGIFFDRVNPPADSGAPSVGVFSLGALVVPQGCTLMGRGNQAFALAANGDITVDGTISVAAPIQRDRPGPGGGAGAGRRLPADPTGDGYAGLGAGGGKGGLKTGRKDGGGGGGAFGGGGGIGGNATNGGAGGKVYGTPELVPLMGGSGGGSGADNDAGRGGHGGGALQIVARGTITVSATGLIDASGSGGEGGQGFTGRGDAGAGGGGGSGGGVLLEAPSVDIQGMIGVNGGGGGQGSPTDQTAGVNGSDGSPQLDGVPAKGSDNMDPYGGGGGNGNANESVDGSDGKAPTDTANGNGGGGGGGAGRIRINTATGRETFTGHVTAVPALTVGTAGRTGG